ncbi:MAG: type II toxin-antitoxin system Phd/YefM family antitoxin [Armatimonadota bacterium]
MATLQRNNQMAIGEVRKQLADICDQVKYTGESVIITKHGKPATAIVPIEDYELLQEMVVRRALKEIRKRGVASLEEIDDDL